MERHDMNVLSFAFKSKKSSLAVILTAECYLLSRENPTILRGWNCGSSSDLRQSLIVASPNPMNDQGGRHSVRQDDNVIDDGNESSLIRKGSTSTSRPARTNGAPTAGPFMSQDGKSTQPNDPLQQAESALLQYLAPGVQYERRAVRLPSTGHVINTLSLGRMHLPTLVLAHGWGAGCAFFGKNIVPLMKTFRVHLIDWLGFGASSRPPFDLSWSPEAAESFFIDALEEWASQMTLLEDQSSDDYNCEGGPAANKHVFAPFHLCGHSLGAFLSVGFALRNPHLVQSLILASPVGVPHAPQPKGPPPSAPLLMRIALAVAFAMWDRHWTPQMFVRVAPKRIGYAIMEKIVASRFPATSDAMHRAVLEYAYQLWVAGPSGEHALSTVLESGAYARRPLCDRLPHVNVPVLILYGDRDWMDAAAMVEVGKQMRAPTKTVTIPDAGHHMYYDNPEDFNAAICMACTEAGVKIDEAI